MTYAALNQDGRVAKHFHGRKALAQAMAYVATRRKLELWECVAGEPCIRFPFVIPQDWS